MISGGKRYPLYLIFFIRVGYRPSRPPRAWSAVTTPFMSFALLEGWRRVDVTDHHAAVDYAKVLKELCDVHFPAAEKPS